MAKAFWRFRPWRRARTCARSTCPSTAFPACKGAVAHDELACTTHRPGRTTHRPGRTTHRPGRTTTAVSVCVWGCLCACTCVCVWGGGGQAVGTVHHPSKHVRYCSCLWEGGEGLHASMHVCACAVHMSTPHMLVRCVFILQALPPAEAERAEAV